MTNYLATITARTINGQSPVRPRLRGRFDPPVSLAEGALDQPVLNRTLQQPPRQNEIESGASEEERYDASSSAAKSFDRLKQHASHSRDREQNEVAAFPTAVTETTDAPAPSVSTFRATSESTPPAQPTRESTHIAASSRERRNTVGATSHTVTPAPEVTTTGTPQLRDQREVASSKATMIEPPPKVRSLKSPGVIEPATPRYDTDGPSHNPTSNSQRVIEREIKTVAVRDRPAQVDGQPSNRLEPTPRIPDANAAGKIEPSESRSVPPAIQPRIEPLAAFTPGRLYLHQSEQHVEPTVHVTIGRIEVRAVQQQSQPAAKPRATQPVMNLDDYLRRRSQGGAR